MAEDKKEKKAQSRRIDGILDDVYKDFFGGGKRPTNYDWLGGGVPGMDLPPAEEKNKEKKARSSSKGSDLSELDALFARSSMQNILATSELVEKTARTANTDLFGNPYPDFGASSANAGGAGASSANAGGAGASTVNAAGSADASANTAGSAASSANAANQKDSAIVTANFSADDDTATSANAPINGIDGTFAVGTESALPTAATPAKGEDKPKEPEKSGSEQLAELIGLTAVKKDVRELVNLVKTQKMRREKGMRTVPVSLHLVFSGNPGTGKTTVARILAKLYKEIGVLSKGQLVEVDRSGLVAGYVGQTAIKTQKKIEEAKGGILFIDEAYTLAKDGGNDFGQEAIDTVLKAMEDNREDLVVIVAGYTDLMEKFINSNPGLKSRFNKYINFEDYTAKELMGIFEMNCKKYSYEMTPEAREAIEAEICEREASKGENFANARDVRNLFEVIITNQASRVAAMDDPSDQDLMTILPEDLTDYEEETEASSHEEGGDSVEAEAPSHEERGDSLETEASSHEEGSDSMEAEASSHEDESDDKKAKVSSLEEESAGQ